MTVRSTLRILVWCPVQSIIYGWDVISTSEPIRCGRETGWVELVEFEVRFLDLKDWSNSRNCIDTDYGVLIAKQPREKMQSGRATCSDFDLNPRARLILLQGKKEVGSTQRSKKRARTNPTSFQNGILYECDEKGIDKNRWNVGIQSLEGIPALS